MIKLVNRVYCQRSADYANDATHTWFVNNGMNWKIEMAMSFFIGRNEAK